MGTMATLVAENGGTAIQQEAAARWHAAKVARYNQTYMRFDKGAKYLALVLHETEVVRVDPRGRVIVDHGGWKTPTTKNRINEALRALDCMARAYQRDKIWYLSVHGWGESTFDGPTFVGTVVKGWG